MASPKGSYKLPGAARPDALPPRFALKFGLTVAGSIVAFYFGYRSYDPPKEEDAKRKNETVANQM
jgi:hypothetical protein